MKLSVIIPVYNVEIYLKNCVDSILKQTYRDLEVILIDDGSTDNSSLICDELAKTDERVIVIHKNNGGVSSARNKGLEIASGELITFVDSDDTLDTEMYEALVKLFTDNDIDIAHCSYKRIDETGTKCIGNSGKLFLHTREEGLECLISGKLFVGGMWNKIYKSKIAKNIRLDENLIINEDVLYNIKAFNNAKSTAFLDKSFYNYYVRKESSATNTTKAIRKARDFVYVSKYIYENITDEELVPVTTNKYANLLCNLYRTEKDKDKRRVVKKELFTLNRNIMYSNNRISVYLIKFFPVLYKLIYCIYDKIRVPNWDVK